MKLILAIAAAFGAALAADSTWQVEHMKTEHGIDQFDALSFFTIHDSDGSKTWTTNDILNIYGILHEETAEGAVTTSEDTKKKVIEAILKLMDADNDGVVSLDEWRVYTENGGTLPDFGLGPGHHMDFESEYELHHWQEFHAASDPDVKIVHPEDIEHERLYHEQVHGDSPESHGGKPWVRPENIPPKYRRA